MMNFSRMNADIERAGRMLGWSDAKIRREIRKAQVDAKRAGR